MKLLNMIVAIGASLASPIAVQAAESDKAFAIVGATVLPMEGPERLTDQTVIISGDRITAVGPRSRVRIPAGVRTIDGRGQVLMPGLVDMHIHLAPAPGNPGDAAQRALAVMLAHGVTTARGMAGSPGNLEVRKRIESGQLPGPRLYAAAPGLNDNNTSSADQGREAVRGAKAAGFDLIKSHALSNLQVWQAIADESRTNGLATAGHVTPAVGLDRAIAAGQQIEHLDGMIAELFKEMAPGQAIEFDQFPPPEVLRIVVNATDAQVTALARRVAAGNSWQVPTLALFEKVADIKAPAARLAAHPDMRFVPDAAIKQWSAQHEQMKSSGFTDADVAAFVQIRRRIVRALHSAKVPLMAGSDTAQAFHIWGPGLHEEITALAAAGLSPLDALRTATVVPRNYLRSLPSAGSSQGWKADFGTVTSGSRADLIMLASDPSRDLGALKRPSLVIAGGRLFDRATLDAMLEKAAADAKALPLVAAPSPPQKQIYLMRHLHKEAGTDPALTAVGKAQAQKLPDFLRAANLKAIFSTPLKRTQQTAAPVAEAVGVPVTSYDPDDPAAMLKLASEVEGNVLIVGHSNTLPDIIGRLGGTPPVIGDNDYGTIYRADSASRLIKSFTLGGTAPAALGPCDVQGLHPATRCGTISVAENRKNPAGRKIDIRFAVLPASAVATDDPIVMLPGGPGLGGVQSGPGTEQMFGDALKSRDLLMIDQRGTGASNALQCPQVAADEDPLGQLNESSPAEVVACRDALLKKADLRFYHTREAVRDMDLVRAALGYSRLDQFAMSYGTRVALDYLRLYPDRVGQTVIRAAAPAEMKLPLWTPRDTQLSFDRMAEACLAQADCAARHPDLKGDLRALLSKLDQGPAPITIKDPRNGKTLTGKLSRNGLGTVMFAMLYIPEFYSQLPPLLAKAKSGAFSPLVQAASPFLLGVGDQVSWGMRWSVVCDEDVRRIDAKSIAAATRGTFMGDAPVRDEMEACSKWPKASVPADYLKPVRSDKPVLIISGRHDPVAGKAWGDVIARTLTDSLHLDVPGASHLPPLPGCTQALVGQFYDGQPLAKLDTACIAQSPLPKMAA